MPKLKLGDELDVEQGQVSETVDSGSQPTGTIALEEQQETTSSNQLVSALADSHEVVNRASNSSGRRWLNACNVKQLQDENEVGLEFSRFRG